MWLTLCENKEVKLRLMATESRSSMPFLKDAPNYTILHYIYKSMLPKCAWFLRYICHKIRINIQIINNKMIHSRLFSDVLEYLRFSMGCELGEHYVPADIVYLNHHFLINTLDIFIIFEECVSKQYRSHYGNLDL